MSLAPLRNSLLLAMGIAGCGEAASDAGAGASPPSFAACVDPVAIGTTGYERCADGSVNRVGPASCEDPAPRGQACDGSEVRAECESDADCTAGAHGRCLQRAVISGISPEVECGCAYGCGSDADCGEAEVCACDGVVGTHLYELQPAPIEGSRCISASCRGPGDCDTRECGVNEYPTGCHDAYFVGCRSDADECRTSGECDSNFHCLKTGEQGDDPFVCVNFQPGCQASGRLLAIAGVAHVALPVRRDDWLAASDLSGHAPSSPSSVSGLPGLRERLLRGALRV